MKKKNSFKKSELRELNTDELSILAVLQKDRNIYYESKEDLDGKLYN